MKAKHRTKRIQRYRKNVGHYSVNVNNYFDWSSCGVQQYYIKEKMRVKHQILS